MRRYAKQGLMFMLMGLFVGFLALACAPEPDPGDGTGDGNGDPSLTVAITSPADGLVTNVTTINVTGTASAVVNSVSKVELQLNSGAFAAVSGTTSWSSNGLVLLLGSNTITVRAISSASTTNSATALVIVDQTGPTANIINPVDGSTNGTIVTVQVNNSDVHSTVATLYVLTNSVLCSSVSTPTAVQNVVISGLANNANNIIAVYAVDSVGNTGLTNSITIYCEAGMPSIAIDAKFSGLITNVATFDVTGTTSLDTFSTYANLMLSTNNGTDYDFTDGSFNSHGGTGSNENWTISVGFIENQTNKVVARAITTTPKTNSIIAIDIIIDTVAPTLGSLNPNPSALTNTNASITFTPVISDNFTGVAHKYYTHNGGAETEFNSNFTVSGLDLGQHIYTVYAVDNANNWSVTNYYTNWRMIANITVSGTLTDNWNGAWKVYVADGDSIDADPKYYEDILSNANTDSFSFGIPSGIENAFIVAYKDVNDNKQWDTGEMRSSDDIETNIAYTDISGLNISIPEIVTYTISGWVSNNTYGHSVGMAAFNSANQLIMQDTPSTSEHFAYSINMEGGVSNDFCVVLYRDDSGNGQLDIDMTGAGDQEMPTKIESFLVVSNLTVVNLTNILNAVLRPECITGTIVGKGVGELEKASVEVSTATYEMSLFISNIIKGATATNYIIPYYVVDGLSYNGSVYLYIDLNNGWNRNNGEPNCKHTNSLSVNGSVSVTNERNFVVNKYISYAEVEVGSEDDNLFSMMGVNGGETNILGGSSITWTNYGFGNPCKGELYYWIDDNPDNGYPDWGDETVLMVFDTISNQTAVTNKFYLIKKTATVTIGGSTVAPNPMSFMGGASGSVVEIANGPALERYHNTNEGVFSSMITVFADDGNGWYDGGEDSIATNIADGQYWIMWNEDGNNTTNFSMWYTN